MSIDLKTEELLSLAEAARRLPKRGNGKAIHVAAIYRWSTTGYAGVILETIQICGQKFTSTEALQRFAEAVTREGKGQLLGLSPKTPPTASGTVPRKR